MTDNMEDPFAENPAVDDGDDPFANAVKTPAVSFDGWDIGSKVRFEVTGPAEKVQQRDFDTNEPKTWDDGNPRMAAVFKGLVDGERRALWCPIPSNLFRGVGEAQAEDGKGRIMAGAVLTIELIERKPVIKNGKKLKPQNIFKVTLER